MIFIVGGGYLPTAIQSLLVSNLNTLMKERGIDTLKELSKLTAINYNTLKCWMSYAKTPRLSSLDRLCDQLAIRTYMLLHPDPDFSAIDNFPKNNSREKIRVNLIVFLREKYSTTSSDKILSEFEGIISRDAYISYLRPQNGRCMPLKTLYTLSLYLSIEPYQLLM